MEFACELTSSRDSCAWKAGSEPQLLTPFPVDPVDPLDPLDPLDPAENSKNVIFAERIVIFGPLSLHGGSGK